MLGYVVTVIVTISLALGNTLPLPVVSPASDPRADHPRASHPLLHLRVMSEMKMNVFRIAINTPTIRPRRAAPRVRSTLRNEQVIAMGRTFIIMPACAFDAYTSRPDASTRTVGVRPSRPDNIKYRLSFILFIFGEISG